MGTSPRRHVEMVAKKPILFTRGGGFRVLMVFCKFTLMTLRFATIVKNAGLLTDLLELT